MNKLLVSLMLFVSFSVVCLSQPKFVIVGGDEYNWGKVPAAQSKVNASVVFKNEGTEILIIKKVNPTCGCTAAKPEKDTLLPGDTTVMNVELRLGAGTGITRKSITIETNDEARARVSYGLVVDIVRDIIFKPNEHINFRGENVVVGQEASETIIIKNNSAKNIKFSGMKIEPDIVKVTVPPDFTLTPNEEIELTGRVTPTKEGHFNAKITFKTDNKDNPTISINVNGHALPNPILNGMEHQENKK